MINLCQRDWTLQKSLESQNLTPILLNSKFLPQIEDFKKQNKVRVTKLEDKVFSSENNLSTIR